jgi:putative nucleotidyltransferase with HDIG domain
MAFGFHPSRPRSSGRRIRLRRKLPRQTSPVLLWLRDERNLRAALAVAAFVAATTLLVSWTWSVPHEYAGQRVERGRVNRVEYSDTDLAATEQRREEARRAAPRVFAVNGDYLARIQGEIEGLPVLVRGKGSLAEVPQATVERHGLDAGSFAELQALDNAEGIASWERWTDRLIGRLATGVPLVAPAEFDAFSTASRRIAAVPPRPDVPGDRARSVPLGRDAVEARTDDPAALRARLVAEATEAGFPLELARVAVAPIVADPRPTVTLDAEATARAADAAAEGVAPVVEVHRRGETIYAPGDTLTDAQAARAADESRRWAASRGTREPMGTTARAAALALALGLLAAALLAHLRPDLLRDWRRLSAVLALVLAPLAATSALSAVFPRSFLFAAVGASMLSAGVLTIGFGLSVALLGALLQAVLAAFALDEGFAPLMAAFASSTAFAAVLRDVRHRSTLVAAALAAAAAGAVAVILAGIADGLGDAAAATHTLGEALVAAVTAAFAGFVVIGLLSTIERISGSTTGLTLTELRDPRQPLLRELQRRAPGTWNHSLQVANIAEAAAEGIGADGLLAYVGALYHDIGKMNKPEYFVENQAGTNRHERLSPAMSLLVIVGHVKDGMELAAEYGLPRSVRQFIETHHGTTLMEYFFHAAQRRAGEQEVNEADFRYPGPKPRTREAAVLMLCDCVESASRTLSEPTPARIEQLVRELSHRRLVDGQFDDSPLTLRELRALEDSIIKSLNAIYHGRISYPSARTERADQAMPRAAS